MSLLAVQLKFSRHRKESLGILDGLILRCDMSLYDIMLPVYNVSYEISTYLEKKVK